MTVLMKQICPNIACADTELVMKMISFAGKMNQNLTKDIDVNPAV